MLACLHVIDPVVAVMGGGGGGGGMLLTQILMNGRMTGSSCIH